MKIKTVLFIVCSLFSLSLIWQTKYLPITDWPQHAEQVSILARWNDPSFTLKYLYEINWFTPYILGLLLETLLAKFTGAFIAGKIFLSLAAIGLPLSLWFLLKSANSDPIWSLTGFVLFYGFAFYWGLANFLFSVPIALWLVALSLRITIRPSRRDRLHLCIGSLVLFFTHGITFFFIAPLLIILTTWRGHWTRFSLTNAMCLVPSLVTSLVWLLIFVLTQNQKSTLYWFSFNKIPGLLGSLPSYLLSPGHHTMAFIVGCILIGLPLLVIRKRRMSFFTFIPLLWFFIFFLGFPDMHGIGLVRLRITIFALPFLLLALRPDPMAKPFIPVKTCLMSVILVWFVVLTGRFQTFDKEARPLDALIEKMEPNKRVLGIMFQIGTPSVPGFFWIHFPAWYQTYKLGYYQYSLTSNYKHNMIRQKNNRATGNYFEGHAWGQQKHYAERVRNFDYFLVHGRKENQPLFRGEGQLPLEKLQQSGRWELYRQKSAL